MDKSTTSPVFGLITGLASLARNGVGLLLSRLELAALEISELCNHLVKLVLVLGLAIMALWFAVAYGTMVLVYFTWNQMGWHILAFLGLVFAGIAMALLLCVWTMMRRGKLSLPVTMAELKADRDILL